MMKQTKCAITRNIPSLYIAACKAVKQWFAIRNDVKKLTE